MTNRAPSSLRPDLALIAKAVPVGVRVLDIGCGDGTLLAHLVEAKGCDACGIELSQAGVSAALAKGLSVIQGDAETDLADYPEGSFDVVILSQTLQTVHRPDLVLAHLLRLGTRAIISFPNFGYWQVRLSLLFKGRMPTTRALPSAWYNTANLHLCTIADFETLCSMQGYRILQADYLQRGHRPISRLGANWRAEQAVYVLEAGHITP
jgi:methionine biosynthesis protein MetW